MNVGQVLETHLGWASKALGRKVAQMIDEAQSPRTIRQFLNQIYGEGASQSRAKEGLSRLEDPDLMTLAKHLRDGIPFATPVFDGATEPEIKSMLRLANLPETGQTVLYDGRTGKAFNVLVKEIRSLAINVEFD